MLFLVPSTITELTNDCAILSNGTYTCFSANGTSIAPKDTKVGTNFTIAYLWYIRIFFIYLIVYLGYYALRWAVSSFQKRNKSYG
jgi:hypothetical protein